MPEAKRYRYHVEGQEESGVWHSLFHYPVKAHDARYCAAARASGNRSICAGHQPEHAEERARAVLAWILGLEDSTNWMDAKQAKNYERFQDFRVRKVVLKARRSSIPAESEEAA
jgi:hypothetical protein